MGEQDKGSLSMHILKTGFAVSAKGGLESFGQPGQNLQDSGGKV